MSLKFKLEEQRLFLEEESKKLDSQPSLNEDKIINAVLELDEDEEQRFLKQMMKGYFEVQEILAIKRGELFFHSEVCLFCAESTTKSGFT